MLPPPTRAVKESVSIPCSAGRLDDLPQDIEGIGVRGRSSPVALETPSANPLFESVLSAVVEGLAGKLARL